MRKLLIAACLSMLALAPAYANDISKKTGKPLTDQQQKMKDCSAEAKAKGFKKEERKAHMKECLGRGKANGGEGSRAEKVDEAASTDAVDAKASRKGKIKACNADAKAQGLSGDERKAFMVDCLKG